MDQRNLIATLAELMSTILDRPIEPGENVSRETEDKWDSLKHIEIIFAVEAAFGIQFTEEQIERIADFNSLAAFVEKADAA